MSVTRRAGIGAACLLAAAAVSFLLPAASLSPSAAPGRGVKLSPGQLLVASRTVSGSGFAESVVLVAQYDENGAVGLLINRPTDVPASRVPRGIEAAKDRNEPIYLGGPVGRTGIMALVRSRTAPAEGTEVLAAVYLISRRSVLEKILGSGASAKNLRIYLGYSGWAAGQLERELADGYWHVLPATPELVFDAQPGTLWARLIDRFEGLRAAQFTAGGPVNCELNLNHSFLFR